MPRVNSRELRPIIFLLRVVAQSTGRSSWSRAPITRPTAQASIWGAGRKKTSHARRGSEGGRAETESRGQSVGQSVWANQSPQRNAGRGSLTQWTVTRQPRSHATQPVTASLSRGSVGRFTSSCRHSFFSTLLLPPPTHTPLSPPCPSHPSPAPQPARPSAPPRPRTSPASPRSRPSAALPSPQLPAAPLPPSPRSLLPPPRHSPAVSRPLTLPASRRRSTSATTGPLRRLVAETIVLHTFHGALY